MQQMQLNLMLRTQIPFLKKATVDHAFVLGANYKVAETWFVTAEYSRIAGDVDTLNIGLRKTFSYL